MVSAVADWTRSPYVEVRGADGQVMARAGDPQGHAAQEVELSQESGPVGTLRVCWRTPSDAPSRAERALVEMLAVPVAVAVHATLLARDVEESRARVVEARASERNRLRADLHDGVGPSLSGAALGLEAALRSEDPARTRDILSVVHREITQLVSEVRCLIDDLGPSGLEHGHLREAIAAHVEAANALGGVQVTCDIGRTPELDFPVEVTVQRIAREAITNVLRHASARTARVSLQHIGPNLVLNVCDDGCGLGQSVPGVGRSSMRDRAESVGGTLTVRDASPMGTTVQAVIPLTSVRTIGVRNDR